MQLLSGSFCPCLHRPRSQPLPASTCLCLPVCPSITPPTNLCCGHCLRPLSLIIELGGCQHPACGCIQQQGGGGGAVKSN